MNSTAQLYAATAVLCASLMALGHRHGDHPVTVLLVGVAAISGHVALRIATGVGLVSHTKNLFSSNRPGGSSGP